MTRADDAGLFIGRVAADAGLTPDAVRYYERLGLVPKPARTSGRFRVYRRDTVARLRFIKQAQKLGLELREIRELLAPANGRRREQCQRVRAIIATHLTHVDVRIAELAEFRRTLSTALDACDRAIRLKESLACPVIEQLGGFAE